MWSKDGVRFLLLLSGLVVLVHCQPKCSLVEVQLAHSCANFHTNQSPTPQPTSFGGSACVHGDPHFKTFSGEHYEFHGEHPGFADSLGIDIHVRAQIRDTWSCIQIGETVLCALIFFESISDATILTLIHLYLKLSCSLANQLWNSSQASAALVVTIRSMV